MNISAGKEDKRNEKNPQRVVHINSINNLWLLLVFDIIFKERKMNLDSLLKPTAIGRVTVRNRIVFPPIDVQIHDEESGAAAQYIEFLTGLVEDNGVGLIISEFTSVANDRFWAPASRIDKDRFVPGFKRLVASVKAHGAKIFMQLAMLGGRAPSGRCIAPSAIESPLYPRVPEALSKEEIKELVNKWIEASVRAKGIGFDGVEVHGGHSYLIGEFMSPHSNRREDEYGGNFEGRMRFPIDIIRGIKAACGGDYPVGIKFSAFEALPEGITGSMAVDMAEWFDKAGVDYLHVSSSTYMLGGTRYPDVPPLFVPEGPLVEFAYKIKKRVSVPVIAVAGITSPEFAARIIKEEKADLVAVGRAMFADPEWASKLAKGKPHEITPCIRCNMCHKKMIIDRAGSVECTVNPALLRPPLETARTKKRVLVVGAGPAGLETSLIASERGHKVILYEKSTEIGGNIRFGCIPPFKSDLIRLLDYYKKRLEKSSVRCNLGCEVTVEKILGLSPDSVIIATGSEEHLPDIHGLEAEEVIFARDFYADESMQRKGSGRVGILGAGAVGCELAWYLALLGRRVFLIDILPYESLLAEEHPTNRFILLEKLDENDVQLMDGVKEVSIEDNGKNIRFDRDSIEYRIPVDSIILASGYRESGRIAKELREELGNDGSFDIYEIGDCARVRDIHWAVREGYEAGLKV
jgi:2,4-dienoyl-CoA reductase-like NADH-dependent reductase (Old Yellow Enzyme family)/thioredoxin reductase